jgi:large subunit ribosomal protein L3
LEENKVNNNLISKETSIEEVSVGETHSEEKNKVVSELDKNVNKYIKFIIGRKVGMTQIFDQNGFSFPATIIDIEPNVITQLKTSNKDGYSSVQLGMGNIKEKNKSKAHIGKFKLNNIPIKSTLKEFRVSDDVVRLLKVGLNVTANIFNIGDVVNISAKSIGKGFAGVMKRHGFGGGRRSHGKNSVMRKPGAIGASADPARVWPGKAMAGRMGGKNVTVKKLNILRIDNNRLFVNGSIPGSANGVVFIKS